MPIGFERNDDRRRITLTATGTVTRDEALAVIDRQVAEGVWAYGIVFDIRSADALPKPSELFEILDYVRRSVREYGPRGALAIVAEPSQSHQGVRTYVSLSDPSRQFATFTDVHEAVRWLEEQPPERPSDTSAYRR